MASDLLTAAKNGYYNQVVNLLKTDSCDLDARDKDKATPLYWSASRGHAHICQVLVNAGCDVNACVKWGSTALHAAADRGHAECLKVLINSGADVLVQNERGDTALHLAAYRGFKDLVQLLVATDRVDPFVKNGQSKTPLQEAQSQQHTSAAAVLRKYMESLGCHPFKSLPMSEKSGGQSPQGQPTSTVPAQSWPRFQSFPMFPDTTPPSELSRHHTYPLQVNNLSQDTKGVGGSHLPQGYGGVGSGSEVRLNEMKNSIGLKGMPGFAAGSKGNSQNFHVHCEPQENVDECMDFSNLQALKETHTQYHNYLHGVNDDQRHYSAHHTNGSKLNQLSRSGSHLLLNTQCSAATLWKHQNGQHGVDAVNKPRSLQTDLCPPDMTPPTHHHHQGYVKHEDLTLFAESLQLEVVKLRDSLSSKERQVTDLEHLVSSMRTRNTQLQQLAAERQSESEQALASKDSELSELKRKLHDLERQNLCLQKAVAEGQASCSQMSAQRDRQVSELTARVNDLERLNTSLQQLLVAQQDTMKGVMASKDSEIAVLRDRVTVLVQKSSSSVVASCEHSAQSTERPGAEHLGHTSEKRISTRSAQSTGGALSGCSGESRDNATLESSVQSSDRSVVYAQSVISGDNIHSQYVMTPGVARSETSEVAARSVISVCDQSVSQSSLPTHSPLSHVHYRPTSQASLTTSTVMTSLTPQATLSTSSVPDVSSSGRRSVSASTELQQCQLRAAVSSLFQDRTDTGKLDADGREWTVGREFQLLDTKPVNCASDGQRRGSCSLVFSITHQGRKYMLKMLTNLINLSYEGHSVGRSLDAHLLHCFGAEFHAPLLLHPHPNIVRVRHHYQGDTSQFGRYLSLLVPPTLDVPVEMARRTTFLVLEHYPQTLQTFMDSFREEVELLQYRRQQDQQQEHHQQIPGDRVWEEFILQMVYQLLSAVEYLQRHDVVHRDIKADNVFLDWRLRPVLGDFGLARTLRGYGGQAVAFFTDPSQVLAGNSHAWAPELCRWNRTDPSTLTQPVSLKDIYSKSDGYAVARMFYHLFPRHDYAPNTATTTTATATASDNDNGGNNNNNSGGDERFPTSTKQQPHYPDSAVGVLPHPVCPGLGHALRSLVLDDPSRRPTVRQALCRVGVLLCKPAAPLRSEEEAEEFCASQLLALSAVPPASSRPSQPEEGSLSVSQSVSTNHNHCLADLFLNFSASDFWEAYSEMTRLGF